MADWAKWHRRHYSVLCCEALGKAVVMDLFEIRLKQMRHRIVAWAEVTSKMREAMAIAKEPTRMVMITLTYRRVIDYKAGHINYYLKLLKQSLGDGLLAFAWVAELQERGAVHYHLVLIVRKGTRIPMPDKSGMWSHGMSETHTARTPFYLVKYVGKAYQKDLARYPKSCRLYAASVRPSCGHWRGDYRLLSGLKAQANGDRRGGGDDRPKWGYKGSSVTEGYARVVLVPTGLEVVN